ncbi:hypothetical protein EMGBS15_14730, partial [Filimonas sp.]
KLCVAQPHDSTRLITCFTKGKLALTARSVFMSTTNSGDLKDDYGLGLTAGLSFETKSFRGFQFGISDYAILKIASSKLEEPDTITKNMNRYEVGLFDVNDAKNRFNMNKLEKTVFEIYLLEKFNSARAYWLEYTFYQSARRAAKTHSPGRNLVCCQRMEMDTTGGWMDYGYIAKVYRTMV